MLVLGVGVGVGVGVGRSVTNDWRKRGGVFYLFWTNSMFLNGVGVGYFVTNGRRKREGVFMHEQSLELILKLKIE